VTPRPAPAWLVRTTAAAVAVVLATGLTAAATTSTPPAAPAAAPTSSLPVEELRAAPRAVVLPEPEPEPEPAPEPPVEQRTRPCRHPTPPEACLGPPPGPEPDARPERVAPPEDRFAFLAGVTAYPAPTTDTIGAANDVAFLRQLLLDSGWRPENIRVVTDGQVTGRALREGMAWLAERGRPGTFSLFHWSGHVKQLGRGTEALWPVDRDWVRDRDVTAALSRVQGRMWVDIAGCEAGSFLPGLPSDRVLVSASSRDVEKSYEYPDWRMSVWSGLVLDLGMRQGQADADGDRRVTVGEALRFAGYYAQVITWSQRPHGRQTPQVLGDPVRGWTLADPPA
jgi:hypothetical protein